MKTCIASFLAATTLTAPAQLLFSEVQQNGNVLLFEQQAGGNITQLPTGAATHLFTTVSRGGRFVSFSAVDSPPGNGLIASSDIYSFDRATRQLTKIIDYTTSGSFAQQQIFSPVTASRSPDGSLLAYGVQFLQRQGLQANGSGVALIVADAVTGLTVSEPAPGPVGPAVDDGYEGAYRGISWAPDGNSFVTPSYFPVAQIGNFPVDGLGIVRFDRIPGTNNFQRGAALSQPQYNTSVIPPVSTAHVFPALSPSGNGLAYFEIFYGGVVGAQPVQASLIISDQNGTRVAVQFNPGIYPGGVSWSADGTRLFYAAGPQGQLGISYLNFLDPARAQIGSVATSPGSQPALVSGLPTGALLPESIGAITTLPGLDSVVPQLSRSGNGFIFTASGLDAGASYSLESSTTLQPGSFASGGTFNGSTVMAGITIPFQGSKYFRLRKL